MKKKLWFRAKDYGWGWQPCTWQGWLVIVAYIAGMFFIASRIDADAKAASDVLTSFIPQSIILTALVIWISAKYGEHPEWRWAGKRVSPRAVLFKSVILVAALVVFTIILMWALSSSGLVVFK